MKNLKTFCLIASIMIVLAASCDKGDDFNNDNNNVPIDYRDKIEGRYICTRTSYSNFMGETTSNSCSDTIFVIKDTSSNQIMVDNKKHYIGKNYYFSKDVNLSTQFEMTLDHGQFDTLGPITIHYVFNQSNSPGGRSFITIDGYKE
jgi:hypothetical protein